MDLEKIKEVISLMDEHGLVEIELSDGKQTIRLKKAGAGPPPPAAGGEVAEKAAEAPAEGGGAGVAEGYIQITAPMVGTFYRASAPDAEPYVEIGDKVRPETVVCIIEAMKVMNEIKAEVEGEIADILVENGDVIEFGQPLFLVKPATPGDVRKTAKSKASA